MLGSPPFHPRSGKKMRAGFRTVVPCVSWQRSSPGPQFIRVAEATATAEPHHQITTEVFVKCPEASRKGVCNHRGEKWSALKGGC